MMTSQSSPADAADGPLPSVWRAFRRALLSQLHPAMLGLVLLPFVVMLLAGVILLWWCWDPLTGWLSDTVLSWGMVRQIDAWLLAVGLVSLTVWLVPVMAAFILLPAAGLLGIAAAAIFVMPLVLRHLMRTVYGDIRPRGQFGFVISAWNALVVILVFSSGWLLTMPLWLFPPLALVLPTLWWTYAFTCMLRLDALVDVATTNERRRILRRHNAGFWALGFGCALLSLLPPAWLILPVFSSLLFGHYALDALQRYRAGQAQVASVQSV